MLNRQRFFAEIGMAYAVEEDEEYVIHWNDKSFEVYIVKS